jgi:NitT/TauT family transport system ATP-binding protein
MLRSVDAPPQRADQPFAVRVRGLRKRFPRSPAGSPDVLGGVDLDVAAGEFVSLVGPSGCGKTTLLSVLAGLEAPSGGTVEIDRDGVACVFQRPLLLPWRSVLDNVTFGLECRGRRARDVRGAAAELLDRMGLGDVLALRPHELSRGMRQRVDLARALLVRPRVLLMDEPFASLDGDTRGAMHDELLAAWRAVGCAVVFVSHDLDEVVTLSDRIVFLSKGPAVVQECVRVDLPRPRSAEDRARLGLAGRRSALRCGADRPQVVR